MGNEIEIGVGNSPGMRQVASGSSPLSLSVAFSTWGVAERMNEDPGTEAEQALDRVFGLVFGDGDGEDSSSIGPDTEVYALGLGPDLGVRRLMTEGFTTELDLALECEGVALPCELLAALEHARERSPICFWSITTPTDVRPFARGMNHAHPDSSMKSCQKQSRRSETSAYRSVPRRTARSRGKYPHHTFRHHASIPKRQHS